MWKDHLSDDLRVPLINADRIMLSVLPEANRAGVLARWAAELRDQDATWMKVAQMGVQSFVSHAMAMRVPFAMETVFSHWKQRPDGSVGSKLDLIKDLQSAGYFVLLFFVGLPSAEFSIMRVQSRVSKGGHAVPESKLRNRFPNTQRAIREAVIMADSAVLVDNSGAPDRAFAVCRVQLGAECLYDIRSADAPTSAMEAWLSVICPQFPAAEG